MKRTRSTAQRAAYLAMAVALSVVACHDAPGTGGLTARIEFGDPPTPGLSIRALRAAAVPELVDRLQILALDTDGSTLAQTNLFAEPTPGQLRLLRAGGTWRLDGVPAGVDRILAGRAYLAPNVDPRLDQVVVYSGEIRGITVVAGQTTDAGILTLAPGPNRLPETDEEPPPPPLNTAVVSRPGGDGLDITWNPPGASDVAGYLVATSTMPLAGPPPNIDPRTVWRVGDVLPPGGAYTVAAVIDANAPRQVPLDDLQNGVPVSILVFAYDGAEDGGPLNYSAAALVFGIPADTLPPGPVTALSAEVLEGRVDVTFVAPGEDGAADPGLPARYEVRSADSALDDPADFDRARAAGAPAVAAPGTLVRFSGQFADFGLDTAEVRHVAVRAVDASSNAGPIANIVVRRPDIAAPQVDAFRPPYALAGLEIAVRGEGFGAVTGTVTLTATETTTATWTLTVSSWEDDELLVRIPTEAASGRLRIERPDGQSAEAFVAVLARIDGVLPTDQPPFGFVATGPRGRVAALYRERGFNVEAAIERFIDLQPEGLPLAPVQPGQRAAAVASAVSAQRFLFASYTTQGRLDVVLVSTGTTASPDPFRQTGDLGPDPADSIGLAARPTSDDRVPALLAFTLQGVLRTAEVADARFDPFNSFFPVSSTVATFDAASIAVAQNGAAALVYRARTSTSARLALRTSADGSAGGFVTQGGPGPEAEAQTIIRAVPGTPDRFVIAYEAPAVGGGQIRLLRAEDFATSPGIAPFDVQGLRLADIGFVTGPEPRLAVVGVRDGDNTELHYTEVHIDALTGAPTVGEWPGVVLDVAPEGTDGRLGCTHTIARQCALAWMGEAFGVLFVRR